MFSSKKDIEGAYAFIVTIILIFVLFYLASLYLHSSLFNQVLNFFSGLITAQVSGNLQTIDSLLLIPLGLDFGVIFLMRFV